MERVLLDCGPHRALLTFNRPEVANAVDWETFEELETALDTLEEWVREDSLHGTLIVTGSGERAFVSGADLGVLAGIQSEEEIRSFSETMQFALNRIADLPVPVIAALNGPALGGGTEVALACDLRVVCENSYFSFKHARVGVVPGWGGCQRLAQILGWRRALGITACAAEITAGRALALGLADWLVPAGQALAKAEEVAVAIATAAPLSVRSLKMLLRESVGLDRTASQHQETECFVRLWASADHKEGVASLLEKRPAHFRGW